MQYPTCPSCGESTPARDPFRFTCRQCGRRHVIVAVKPAGERNQTSKKETKTDG